MKIVVCPLSHVARLVAAHAPQRVVSLLDPGFTFPELGPEYRERHLRLALHDVHEVQDVHEVPDGAEAEVVPGAAHVAELLAFLTSWRRSAPILIHCRAGIGRSTAAAFIAACLHQPDREERALALDLRRASPGARPNEMLVRWADAALERNGRMLRAIEETGRGLTWQGVDENEPFELACEFPCATPHDDADEGARA